MARIEILSEIAESLHRLHENVGVDWESDPYTFPPTEECNCRHEASSRSEIISYIKERLLDTEFINTILSDSFLDEDDPEVLRNNKIVELKKQYTFSDSILDMIADISDDTNGMYLDSNGESDDIDDFINDINTSDEYIVVFDDSDGERLWYKKVPNRDILKYVIKSEHRKCIGCGCNQYIHMIIKNKEVVDMDID